MATDDVGTWVYTPAGSTFTTTTADGHVGVCDVAQDAQGRGRHCVTLLPAVRWFVAHWVLGSEFTVNIDISTPPTRSGPNWTFDDLELDPFLRRDGTFGVEDEDEFVAGCAAGLIDDRERDAARLMVDVLRGELAAGTSPMLATGLRHLTDAVSRNLAPLVGAGA